MNDDSELTKFAKRYAEAWCSQDPEKVAAFYARSGSISVNGGSPVPVAEIARGFAPLTIWNWLSLPLSLGKNNQTSVALIEVYDEQ
jgi:hypothetical protein